MTIPDVPVHVPPLSHCQCMKDLIGRGDIPILIAAPASRVVAGMLINLLTAFGANARNALLDAVFGEMQGGGKSRIFRCDRCYESVWLEILI